MLHYFYLLAFTLLQLHFEACAPPSTQSEQPASETVDPAPREIEAPPSRVSNLHKDLFSKYDRYREKTIRDRRFKHKDIIPLIQQLRGPFSVALVGRSIEDREIYKVTLGNGPVKVLLWSQMHGDESTATMALMDMFNFFVADDEFNELRRQLLNELTIVVIPLLNPDGAERFQRRNALGIDLNRDAVRLQCPESRILKQVRDELHADWGFNLHDQNRYYAAGRNAKTATISFLAPAYNVEKEINTSRGNAMRLIGLMNAMLQNYIPGQVARYDDEFEPRAFGDNIQKWGTSTILIECGGMPNDPDKQYIRKLHFVALLTAFDAIARKQYEPVELSAYEQIPYNDNGAFHDLILREVQIEKGGENYLVDIGYQRREVSYDGNRQYYYSAEISDMGDLSVFHAYDELEGQGYKAVPGKTYTRTIASVAELKKLDAVELLRQGYTAIRMQNPPTRSKYVYFPFKILTGKNQEDSVILPGRNPSLVMKKGSQARYVAVNGFLFDLDKDQEEIRQLINGL